MVRALGLVALLALPGCLTYGRTKGAKTLERGQVELTWQPGAFRSDETGTGLPFPEGGGVETRFGVREDLDVGIQYYVLGMGMDVRHRFVHRGPWHVAVAPGMGALVQPNLLNTAE
ncbi:MAG: hypothetical protein KC656_14530, partial [Myxococcales bacterium]|nr:hypothetical protein [Myxococcales bacterium]